MQLSRKTNWRIGASLLLATTPLMLLASGCGGGGAPFNPLPTETPVGTATATTIATPSATSTPTVATAIDFSSLGSGFDNEGSLYEHGWQFTANRRISVTSLGFYDQLKDGLATNHKVGIFDVDTKKLIASTTVLRTDPLTGFFRFHSLTTPVTLSAGKDYYIVAIHNSASDGYASFIDPITIDSAITFIGTASNADNGTIGDLLYPNLFVPDLKGGFGPNFLFKPNP